MGYIEEPVEINYVAVDSTTEYDATTLPAGHGSYYQVLSNEDAGFEGTIETSDDGGETWSDPITVDSSSPSTFGYEDFIEFTDIKVTVTSGAFNIFYR
jgi:hypothetical protein